MAYTTLEQIKIRLKQFHSEGSQVVFDREDINPLIEQLIQQVTDEIKRIRNYPDDYTEDQIETDMTKYQTILINAVVYDMSQAGEAYMQSYSENGISRSWVDRGNLLAKVVPLAKIV